MSTDETPASNELISYQLRELHKQNAAILSEIKVFQEAFNTHTRDDAVLAAEVLRLAEAAKNRPGMWVSLVAAGAAVAAAIAAFMEKHT
jgi:hypothetical protein